MKRLARVGLAWALATLAVLGVFTLYLQPEMVLTLANHLWSCI